MGKEESRLHLGNPYGPYTSFYQRQNSQDSNRIRLHHLADSPLGVLFRHLRTLQHLTTHMEKSGWRRTINDNSPEILVFFKSPPMELSPHLVGLCLLSWSWWADYPTSHLARLDTSLQGLLHDLPGSYGLQLDLLLHAGQKKLSSEKMCTNEKVVLIGA